MPFETSVCINFNGMESDILENKGTPSPKTTGITEICKRANDFDSKTWCIIFAPPQIQILEPDSFLSSSMKSVRFSIDINDIS